MALKGATAGERNRLVTIQRVTQAKGPSGRPVETWTLLGQAWMARQDESLRTDMAEHFDASVRTARSDVTWRMPYQANMDPESVNVPKERRLVYQNRVYNIVLAAPGADGTIVLTTMANTAVTA